MNTHINKNQCYLFYGSLKVIDDGCRISCCYLKKGLLEEGGSHILSVRGGDNAGINSFFSMNKSIICRDQVIFHHW